MQNNLSYKYDYDSIGRLIRQEIRNGDSSSHIGSTEFGYDMSNNLTRLTNEIGGRTISQYYSYSAVSGYSNTANYAKDNLPTQYKISGTRHAEYDYDSINRINLRTFSTNRPLYNNYVYWLATDRNTAASVSNTYRTTLLKNEIVDNTAYSYTYDDVGNITSIQKGERKVANSSTSTDIVNASAYRSYTYDALGQLTRENNVTDNKTTVFSYDGLGNILSKQEYAYTTGTLGTASKTIAYTYSDDNKSGWNNLLTSVDLNGNGTISSSETISYDAIGNPVTYLGKTLSWFGRQLVTFINGSTTIANTYDSNGLRGSKTVNGETTIYQYIGGKLMYESRPGIELYYFYDSYGNLTSIRYIKSGETTAYSYYVTTNAQGDVLGIYTAAGVQVAAYEYDAWGNCTVYDVTQDSDGNNIFTEATYSDSQKFNMEFLNPFRYRGYYYDQDMGLYYLQSRYYDPQVGRFINADSYVSTGKGILGYNMFAYCLNRPVNMRDDIGNDPVPVWAINIINGTASSAEYNKALTVNANAWAGSARYKVDYAIGIAQNYSSYENYFLQYGEHKKRGTTSPSKLNKHQKGQTRKQKDNFGEKGDARRTPNPNKRKRQNFSVGGEQFVNGTIAVLGTIAVVYFVANDITGVGVTDDGAIAPLLPIIWDSANKVFQ